MGYDLAPRNKKIDWFHTNVWTWGKFLENAVGLFFTEKHKGGRYVWIGTEHKNTKPLNTMGNRYITAFEAKVLARMAKNYVDLWENRHLIDNKITEEDKILNVTFKDVIDPLTDVDLERLKEFAKFAEESNGFRIN